MCKSVVLSVCLLVVVVFAIPSYAQGLGPFCGVLNDGCDSKCGLILTGAYITTMGDTRFSMTNDFNQGSYVYHYDSFQIGAAISISLNEKGNILLGGTIAIPNVGRADELWAEGGLVSLSRKWNADTFAATVDALYSYPVYQGVSLISGFRWINWQTSFASPYGAVGVDAGDTASTDKADVTINGYVPLIGMTASSMGVTVGAVGFPTVPGRIEQRENWNQHSVFVGSGNFTGGYFIEGFLDYGLPAFTVEGLDAACSVFTKVSYLHADATTHFTEALSGTALTPSAFSLHRRLFVIGGKASVSFQIPNFLN